jgi:ribosome-binding protein aMBF1 (putative translation factor)
MQADTLPNMAERYLATQLGVVVRRRRQRAGLSQEDFADRCGLHRTYIGSIERGEKAVTLNTASKLSAALGLKLWQLVKEAEERT